MPTPHIESDKELIAKRVIMPGDPFRAAYIAKNFLEGSEIINRVRGNYAYTGKYKGVDVTVFASGMGIGSMGIYSYELFNDYDVECIIRVGTAGSYDKKLNVRDIILVDSACSSSSYDEEIGISNLDTINSSSELNEIVERVANMKRIPITIGRAHTTEAFYNSESTKQKFIDKGCICTEMETYAMLYNAHKFHKKATTLVTISDNLATGEKMSSEEREIGLNKMITLALDSIIKYEI